MWSPGWIVLFAVVLNWGMPFQLCWLYTWIAHFNEDFIHAGYRAGPHICFEVTKQGMASWHMEWWNDIAGVGLFTVMILRLELGPEDDAAKQRALLHLSTHSWQWVILGMLYPVLYAAHYYFIKWFQHDKNPYLDNFFERQARRRACQQISIPREDWNNHAANGNWFWW
jgi:hypothetical protein